MVTEVIDEPKTRERDLSSPLDCDTEGTRDKAGLRLTPFQKRIFDCVTTWEQTHGEQCLTKREIAQTVGCSFKTVDRAIAVLRKHHLVEVVPRHQLATGAQVGNVYRVTGEIVSRYTETQQ